MRRLASFILLLLYGHIGFSQRYDISTVFSSEPQNKMASEIPGLLLEAFRNGDLAAYYPQNINSKVYYAQFLNHFGEKEKAQEVLRKNPVWFCKERELPRISREAMSCLNKRFDIAEVVEFNRFTGVNEKKHAFIRIIHDSECDPRGIQTMGPVFKMEDILKLRSSRYMITNPQNSAVKYSIADLILLRLYASRKPMSR